MCTWPRNNGGVGGVGLNNKYDGLPALTTPADSNMHQAARREKHGRRAAQICRQTVSNNRSNLTGDVTVYRVRSKGQPTTPRSPSLPPSLPSPALLGRLWSGEHGTPRSRRFCISRRARVVAAAALASDSFIPPLRGYAGSAVSACPTARDYVILAVCLSVCLLPCVYVWLYR